MCIPLHQCVFDACRETDNADLKLSDTPGWQHVGLMNGFLNLNRTTLWCSLWSVCILCDLNIAVFSVRPWHLSGEHYSGLWSILDTVILNQLQRNINNLAKHHGTNQKVLSENNSTRVHYTLKSHLKELIKHFKKYASWLSCWELNNSLLAIQ